MCVYIFNTMCVRQYNEHKLGNKIIKIRALNTSILKEHHLQTPYSKMAFLYVFLRALLVSIFSTISNDGQILQYYTKPSFQNRALYISFLFFTYYRCYLKDSQGLFCIKTFIIFASKITTHLQLQLAIRKCYNYGEIDT